jgi:hypothetical protein
MKIAVCFSGQIRTGLQCSNSILNYIGDLLPNVDFFVHTWDIETVAFCEIVEHPKYATTADRPLREEIEKIPSKILEKLKIDNFLSIYNPKVFAIHNQNEYFQKNKNGNICGIPPIYFSWHEVNKFKQSYENENNFVYDLVIHLRPDIAFNSNRKLENDIKNIDLKSNTLTVYRWDPQNVPEADIKIEDVHFLGNSKVMDITTNFVNYDINTFYNQIDRQILHFNYVNKNNIKINSLTKKDFIVYRYFMDDVQLSLDEVIYKKNNNLLYFDL